MENNGLNSTGGGNPSLLERISFYGILVLTFLLPLFITPGSPAFFEIGKVALATFVVLAIFFCAAFVNFREKKLVLPKNLVLLSVLLIPILMFVSALVNGNIRKALIGNGAEISTISFVAILVVLFISTLSLITSRARVVKVYSAFFISFAIVILYQIIRLFAGEGFLSLGVLTSPTANIIGRWNDLGIFVGAGTLFSLLTLEFMSVSKAMKIVFGVAALLGVFFLFLVNFPLIWYTLLFAVLVVIAYKIVDARRNGQNIKTALPIVSIVTALIMIVLVIAAPSKTATPENYSFIAKKEIALVNYFKVSQIEVRPSLLATMDIAKATIKGGVVNAILGTGPNTFSTQYLLNKPAGVNETIFWSYNFDYGVSYILTFLVTTGILGLIAWLAFIILFLYKGIRALIVRIENPFSKYLTVSSFVLALYFWTLSSFYVTGVVNTVLAFIFVGVFFAVQAIEGNSLKTRTILVGKGTWRSLILAALLLVLVILPLIWAVSYIRVLVSRMYFQNGVEAVNSSLNLVEAEVNIRKAAQWYMLDVYPQALTEIGLIRLEQLLNDKSRPEKDVVADVQVALQNTILYAQAATSINPNNHQNWVMLGKVYEYVSSLDKRAYEAAVQSYTEAIKRNPSDPSMHLVLARLEFGQQKYEEAKKHIASALNLKNNYTEAAFLLSQVQVQEGKISDAINSVTYAIQSQPNNPLLYFQLGLLYYNEKNYKTAVDVLKQAITLDNQYSNARYFLGLSYSKLGEVEDAIAQFVEVQKLNPENEEVALILRNLRAGRAPFTDAKPPVTSQPETRQNLPVRESRNR